MHLIWMFNHFTSPINSNKKPLKNGTSGVANTVVTP